MLELAEEDRTWIGRHIDDWAADDDSLSATLSRRVVIALLEASEDPRFEAVGIDIVLTPLPSATFRLAPRAAGFPMASTRCPAMRRSMGLEGGIGPTPWLLAAGVPVIGATAFVVWGGIVLLMRTSLEIRLPCSRKRRAAPRSAGWSRSS